MKADGFKGLSDDASRTGAAATDFFGTAVAAVSAGGDFSLEVRGGAAASPGVGLDGIPSPERIHNAPRIVTATMIPAAARTSLDRGRRSALERKVWEERPWSRSRRRS